MGKSGWGSVSSFFARPTSPTCLSSDSNSSTRGPLTRIRRVGSGLASKMGIIRGQSSQEMAVPSNSSRRLANIDDAPSPKITDFSALSWNAHLAEKPLTTVTREESGLHLSPLQERPSPFNVDELSKPVRFGPEAGNSFDSSSFDLGGTRTCSTVSSDELSPLFSGASPRLDSEGLGAICESKVPVICDQGKAGSANSITARLDESILDQHLNEGSSSDESSTMNDAQLLAEYGSSSAESSTLSDNNAQLVVAYGSSEEGDPENNRPITRYTSFGDHSGQSGSSHMEVEVEAESLSGDIPAESSKIESLLRGMSERRQAGALNRIAPTVPLMPKTLATSFAPGLVSQGTSLGRDGFQSASFQRLESIPEERELSASETSSLESVDSEMDSELDPFERSFQDNTPRHIFDRAQLRPEVEV